MRHLRDHLLAAIDIRRQIARDEQLLHHDRVANEDRLVEPEVFAHCLQRRLIGIAAGLISFVPYLGSLSGLVISMCVAIAQFWPHWAVIWIVPAIFFVGQTLSDYLLSPYFVGRRVNLNPVWIMFALFAFGYLFGFVGLLIAVPLASAIGVLTRFALQRYYESFLYTAIPRATVTDAVRLTPSDKKMD